MSHTLTGVWVEIPLNFFERSFFMVTPSRVCELKCFYNVLCLPVLCHTLTGVWVEIGISKPSKCKLSGHTLTGVWVEIKLTRIEKQGKSHTLTGVWVEIAARHHEFGKEHVTPSRVCELKCQCSADIFHNSRHTLTGVWVEMFISLVSSISVSVTPSRVCELK